jgi:ABC-type Fe3+/spermidine/putrescine transport system ATPase subunit
LLLLDEPLSALDEKIRREMQGELRDIQQRTGTTFIYVTHDQEEALTMSDRIAVLNRGRCVQCDRPERIFRNPRTRFVAEFFRGCNVLEAELESNGTARLHLAGRSLAYGASDAAAGARAIAVRGERVLLAERAKEGDIVLPTRLESVTYRGLYSDYRLKLPDGQELSAALPHRHDLSEGETVEVGLRREDLVLLEED